MWGRERLGDIACSCPPKKKQNIVATVKPADGNLVLSNLSSADFLMLEPHLERFELPVRLTLEKPQQPPRYVYFPDRGIASVVESSRAFKRNVEIGLIGREGFVGMGAVLFDEGASNHTYMQVAGAGRRLRIATLREAMSASVSLRASLLRFVHAFFIQVGQTASANIQSNLNQRLSRWLLMAHDRIHGDELPLTHEFLSLMLGVRRAGVTVAANELIARGLIGARRGHIIVIDRAGLEKAAGGAYGVSEAVLKRHYGGAIKSLGGARKT